MEALPDELIALIMNFLPLRDVLRASMVCKRLHVIAESNFVQSRLDFLSERVHANRFETFSRAARCGNFGAAMKLGVCSLYAEGVEIDAKLAAEMLILADTQAHGTAFAWALVRPPWSTSTCTKARVFQALKQHVDLHTQASPHVVFSVGKVFRCCPEDEMFDQGRVYIERAALGGCDEAIAELYNIAVEEEDESMRAKAVRMLHTAMPRGHSAVLRALTQELVAHAPTGSDRAMLAACFQMPLQRTISERRRVELSGSMRYILFDWLVEVCDIKQYEQRTLLLACRLVDLYTQHLPISRGRYQLLGIAAMVVAARCCESDVITVREAAWLTDNTYTYEDVVRTMADLMALSRTELKALTHMEMLERFLAVTEVSSRQRHFMFFIAELAMLHIHSSMFPSTLLAAAIFVLVSLAEGLPQCWPGTLQHLTGLRARDPRLHACIKVVHERLWEHDLNSPNRVRDSRGTVLRTIESKYWSGANGMHAPARWLPTAETVTDTLHTMRTDGEGTPRKRHTLERGGSARTLGDLSNCEPMSF
eukprot:m.238057 g.238057  ORF g.238057 m.238057 type:complete len:536 (+) comp21551_c0_seq1:87-1694(+)